MNLFQFDLGLYIHFSNQRYLAKKKMYFKMESHNDNLTRVNLS